MPSATHQPVARSSKARDAGSSEQTAAVGVLHRYPLCLMRQIRTRTHREYAPVPSRLVLSRGAESRLGGEGDRWSGRDCDELAEAAHFGDAVAVGVLGPFQEVGLLVDVVLDADDLLLA